MNPSEEAAKVAEAASTTEPKPRLLVIDDEVALGASLSRVFSRRGYEVQCESDPLEAVISAQQFAPDVVLLDLRLPNVSGIDLLREMKARMSDVQIVMMTGDGDV